MAFVSRLFGTERGFRNPNLMDFMTQSLALNGHFDPGFAFRSDEVLLKLPKL
jgi:hypothetical protein